MGFLSKLKDKLDMYDNTLSGYVAKSDVMRVKETLDTSKIAIGYNHIQSETQISKYYMINKYPSYIHENLVERMRGTCLSTTEADINNGGEVRMNFYFYSEPFKIAWDSPAMRNKLAVWKRLLDKKNEKESVFDMRENREQNLVNERIIQTTLYLNEAELEHKRTTCKVMVLVEFVVDNTDRGVEVLSEALNKFKVYCNTNEIRTKEIRISVFDWLQSLSVFSLKNIREINKQKSYRTMTDDILCKFNVYKQGKIGNRGVPLGMDIHSKMVVLKKIKSNPDKAENWLIASKTGTGKSFYIKCLLTYLLADNFVVTVMDYEGDEYLKIAKYLRGENDKYKDDVLVISMGKKSSFYFDPLQIADLTGEEEIDEELKETAIRYTIAMIRCIVEDDCRKWTLEDESVISRAIREVYLDARVTENRNSWKNSKGLTLKNIYETIQGYVDNKTLADPGTDDVEQKAASSIERACRPYFQKGGSKSGTFAKPIPIDNLYKAKFIVFSFGMKGENENQSGNKDLALKQISVANISIQISNYCKYVKGKFNVKVWEEYQRWGRAEGSSDIIINALTGGRKRGDVNFLITTDLNAILDEKDKVCSALLQSFTSMVIGVIDSNSIREKFCKVKQCEEILGELELIAKAASDDDNEDFKKEKINNYKDPYKNSFCLVLDTNSKAVVQAQVPRSILESRLFSTGVEKKQKKEGESPNKI